MKSLSNYISQIKKHRARRGQAVVELSLIFILIVMLMTTAAWDMSSAIDKGLSLSSVCGEVAKAYVHTQYQPQEYPAIAFNVATAAIEGSTSATVDSTTWQCIISIIQRDDGADSSIDSDDTLDVIYQYREPTSHSNFTSEFPTPVTPGTGVTIITQLSSTNNNYNLQVDYIPVNQSLVAVEMFQSISTVTKAMESLLGGTLYERVYY